MIFALIVILIGANTYAANDRIKEIRENDAPFLRSAHRNLIIGICVADMLLIGGFVFILCRFEPRWFLQICIILIGAAVFLFAVGMMVRCWNWKPWVFCGLCAVVGVSGIILFSLYQYHLDRITVPDDFDFTTYAPFVEDTPVAKLEETPTLRFKDTDSLPRMDGATALYPVYAAFAQATYPDSMSKKELWMILETVDCSTTGSAYRKIVDRACDIIFVAGPSQAQEDYAEEKGVELIYTPIGREAFVFFVHPDNPIYGLTLDDIRGIYSGQITDWSSFGLPKLGSIRAYQRTEGSGSQTALERFVMRDIPLMKPEEEYVEDDMGDMVSQVSSYKNHRNAIGYSFRFYCTALMKDFNVKLLAINGIEPTVENIENGTYPLASEFYAVTRTDADENTRALIEWIAGPQGQALVERTGYIKVQNKEG